MTQFREPSLKAVNLEFFGELSADALDALADLLLRACLDEKSDAPLEESPLNPEPEGSGSS